MTSSLNPRPPQSMLVIARGADAELAALHTDLPDKTMLINKGDPHFWPFAKFDVHPNQITEWKSRLESGASGVFGEEKGEPQAKVDVTRM